MVKKIDDAFRRFLFKHNGKTRKIRPFFSNSIIPVNYYSKLELKKLLSTPKWKGGLFFLDHNVFIHARIFCHNSQPLCIYLILLCLQWKGFKRISFLFQTIRKSFLYLSTYYPSHLSAVTKRDIEFWRLFEKKLNFNPLSFYASSMLLKPRTCRSIKKLIYT